MKKPFFLIFDSSVDEYEKMIAINTVERATQIFHGREAKVLGTNPTLGENGEKVSADSIVLSARKVKDGNYGPQYDARDIWETLFNCSRQKQEPFIGIFITARDLTAKLDGCSMNFCYGYAAEPIAVISLARLRGIPGQNTRALINGIIMHKLGHVFGLASDREKSTEDRLGRHCTSRHCVMRQGLNRKELLAVFKDAEHREYCALCRNDMKKIDF